MFTVGKLFHLAHLVDDLDVVDRWYDDIFACQRFYRSYERAARREASLLVISDMLMEPILPSRAPEDGGTPLAKFHARFGNRLHSIAWYVDDITEFSAHLGTLGLRQVGLTGKPVTDPATAVAVWTHPRETHALLEFCEPGFAKDPRLDAGWSAAFWRDQHPLGIERTSHISCLFDHVEDADGTYVEALGGRFVGAADRPDSLRRYYAVGEETVIEAVQPLDPNTDEGRDFARNGEGVFSLTFATKDLAQATRFLQEQAQPFRSTTPNTIWLDLDPGFGLRVAFTDTPAPNGR